MDGSAATEVVWRDEVREAIARLPERQRVALELRERKGLAYEQIAASLGTGSGPVAQLLERARINLYDELRGTPLASVAAPSADCERAMPLIAARQDGELAPSSEDAAWLDGHLAGCERCRLGEEQMRDAAAFYGGEASPPMAAAPPPDSTSLAASPDPAAPTRDRSASRRRAMLGGGLAALALAGAAAALAVDGGSPDAAPPAADAAAKANIAEAISAARVVKTQHKARTAPRHSTERGGGGAGVAANTGRPDSSVSTPAYAPAAEAGGGGSQGESVSGPHRTAGQAAVQPATQKPSPKPASKPKPPTSSAQASQPTAQPAPEPPPPPEAATPPAEEPAAEHGHKGEPPGKPSDRPPHK